MSGVLDLHSGTGKGSSERVPVVSIPHLFVAGLCVVGLWCVMGCVVVVGRV